MLMSSESHHPARDETSNEEVVKHGPLYYHNGDIVLLSLPATEDNIITAFKVDKIFLSRHSPVFEGMLSLPLPDDVEKFDDVPLVRLQDQAEHLASFLAAVYDATSLPFAKHGQNTIGKLEGVIKLATKYQVDALRERVVDLVSADWPSDLESWDVNEVEIGHLKQKYEYESAILEDDAGDALHAFDVLDALDYVLPEPCKAIRLARDYNIKQILPAAFYHLSRIPALADRHTMKSKGPNYNESYWDYEFSQGRTANFSLLSSQDLLCLLLGVRAMAPTVLKLATEAQRNAKGQCISRTPMDCKAVLDRFIVQLHRDAAGYSEYDSYDPLETFLCKKISQSGTDGVCKGCMSYFPREMRRARSVLWNRLPDLFGLEEW